MPEIDGYGMHARGCECARCAAGYGPTEGEREAARRAALRAQAGRASEAARAARGERRSAAAEERAERARARAEATRAEIERVAGEPRPLDPAELAELARVRVELFGRTRHARGR